MEFTTTAPGRICLFGEHQDYLGLPVIAAAIGVRLCMEVTIESPLLNRYRIMMPDIGEDELINTAMPLSYQRRRDYLRSVMKVLREEGIDLPQALTAIIRSEIPIAAGTSSSSALIMAWVASLLHGNREGGTIDPLLIARYAHRAEVIEFGESGGMMDHLSIGYGGVCHFDFSREEPLSPLRAKPEGFVLGDSEQPKDTLAILTRTRKCAESAVGKMKKYLPGFDLKTTPLEEAADAAGRGLSGEENKVLLGNLRNRDILREAFDLLSDDAFDQRRLGALLMEHHELLRDNLSISTPKIEAMMDGAMEAGALGGKINGSGGGGCMFVFAPGRENEACDAIRKAGGKAHPVRVAEGVKIIASS